MLARNPDDPRALLVLGLARLETGRTEEAAERHYRDCLRLRPHHANALNGLATVHEARGEIARAEVTYRQVLEWEPESKDAARSRFRIRSPTRGRTRAPALPVT